MPGLMRGMARTAAVVGTANAVTHHQQQKYAAQAESQSYGNVQAPAQPVTVVAPAPAVDPTQQLQQLAALRDSGVITEEEFQAKKTEILAAM